MKRPPQPTATQETSAQETSQAGLMSRSGSSQPLYRQIKKMMTQSLGQSEWRPGAAIPTEFELAARYKVSQGTVRKAIDELVAEKLVVRRQGVGTFVATHHASQDRLRFLRLRSLNGPTPWFGNRILSCERLRATSEVARQIDLKAGDAVLRIRRILTAEDVPVVLDEIWLPAHLFKGLTLERLQALQGTIYAFFESEFGMRMLRAEEKIRAVAADADAAELLAVPLQTPLLSVERVAVTYGDRPVELRRGLYLTLQHYYRNELG